MKRKIIILVLAIAVNGCVQTTTLQNIPREESDFNYSLSHLRKNFTDINEYDINRKFTFFEEREFPKFEELKKTWGEPVNIETKWGHYSGGVAIGLALVAGEYLSTGLLGLATAYHIFPHEIYEWKKGNISIKAHTAKNGASNYEAYIYEWEWTEKEN